MILVNIIILITMLLYSVTPIILAVATILIDWGTGTFLIQSLSVIKTVMKVVTTISIEIEEKV